MNILFYTNYGRINALFTGIYMVMRSWSYVETLFFPIYIDFYILFWKEPIMRFNKQKHNKSQKWITINQELPFCYWTNGEWQKPEW